MTWYAAHIIAYVQFPDGNQDRYPVWENIVLIEAGSVDQAYEAAEQIGRRDYQGGTLSWNERPGSWVFAGIRKLIECQDTPGTMSERRQSEWRPGHGTEITYLQLELDSADTLSRLVQGEAVQLLYEE